MGYYTYTDPTAVPADEEFTLDMTIAEMEEFEEANPHLNRVFKVLRMSYHGYGVKIDAGFRDVLNGIKKQYPRSTINVPGIK